jgi:mannose-6-phosphate isomerase-like protein (cupin superfamily)
MGFANVDAIPALGAAAASEHWRQWTDEPRYEQGWRSVRRHFAIAGFCANAKEVAEGELLVVPHREEDYGGQEELYFVFAGRARFILDGAEVELASGDLLHIGPQVHREARALETPTKVLMISSTPSAAYAPD